MSGRSVDAEAMRRGTFGPVKSRIARIGDRNLTAVEGHGAMERGETVHNRPAQFRALLHTALRIIGQNIYPRKPRAPMAEPIGPMRRLPRGILPVAAACD